MIIHPLSMKIKQKQFSHHLHKQTTIITLATIHHQPSKMSTTTESTNTNSNQNNEEFRIARLTDLEKIKELFHGWAAREGWCPGATDLELYYQIDPNGFFVGKIGSTEKIVSIVSAVAYGDEYGFMGFYVVDPNFRGKNYGRPLFCAALDYLKSSSSDKKQRLIALEAVEAQAHNYVKCGFQTAHYTRRFAVTIDDLLQSLTTAKAKATALAQANTKNDENNQENDENMPQKQPTTTTTTTMSTDGSFSQKIINDSQQVRFVDASTLPLQKIAQYDSEIFGYDRTQFLRKLFELSAISLVALRTSSTTTTEETEETKDKAENDENDEKIVGFGSIRLGGEDYYRVGPLFADSVMVARDLLFELSSKLKLKLKLTSSGENINSSSSNSSCSSGGGEQAVLYMDVHVPNRESIELMSETIGAKALFDTGRMYVGTGEHVKYQVNRVFVATSLEAG